MPLSVNDRIIAFAQLGQRLQALKGDTLEDLLHRAKAGNPWFASEQVQFALEGWAESLTRASLENWLSDYHIPENAVPKKVGIVAAGNIPLVGFHDLMSVLLAGQIALIKLSADDTFLMNYVIGQLREINNELGNRIEVVERLNDADAFIATGSNNSARYFEYYFSKKPHIIRKNRTSLAVLNGKESDEELTKLGEDIFRYFGLGCRNVSKVYVPVGYDHMPIMRVLEGFKDVFYNNKYSNNYDYNRAIYLVKQIWHLDNAVILYKEDEALVSPIGVLYWQFYENAETLKKHLEEKQEQIQCIVSECGWFEGSISLGQAQKPGLKDYADGVDTIKFLLSF